MLSKFTAVAAAAAMLVAPVAASAAANPAASLSVAKSARAGSSVARGDQAAGGNALVYVLGALLAGAFIYAIVDGVDDGDSDSN